MQNLARPISSSEDVDIAGKKTFTKLDLLMEICSCVCSSGCQTHMLNLTISGMRKDPTWKLGLLGLHVYPGTSRDVT